MAWSASFTIVHGMSRVEGPAGAAPGSRRRFLAFLVRFSQRPCHDWVSPNYSPFLVSWGLATARQGRRDAEGLYCPNRERDADADDRVLMRKGGQGQLRVPYNLNRM